MAMGTSYELLDHRKGLKLKSLKSIRYIKFNLAIFSRFAKTRLSRNSHEIQAKLALDKLVGNRRNFLIAEGQECQLQKQTSSSL